MRQPWLRVLQATPEHSRGLDRIGSLTRKEPRRSGGFDSGLDALGERVGVLGRGSAGEADQ
jgi:hypothetical protein